MWQITAQEAQQLYEAEDAAHGFEHVLRVFQLALKIGALEGADLEILTPATLLHDVESSMTDKEKRKNHHLYSASFAGDLLREHGWEEERIQAVQHCIRAHRFRDERETPQSLEAKVLFDADKLDSIGAVGAARAIAVSVERGLPFYQTPSNQFLESGRLAAGEEHTAYHEYWFKLKNVRDRLLTDGGRLLAEKRHQTMCFFFEQLAEEIESCVILQN